MLKQFLFGGPGTGFKHADVGLLLFRVVTGLMLALGHGKGKLPSAGLEKFAGKLAELNVPAPTASAWAAMFAEFVGGLLVAAGLLTRPAALLIAITMLVAVSTAHANDPIVNPGGPSKELALLYLSAAVLLLFTGSGRYAVDPMLRQRSRGSSRSR
jgi:putative oxidoreductase